MSSKILGDERLHKLQRDTFGYFLEETNPRRRRKAWPGRIGTSVSGDDSLERRESKGA